MIVMTGSFRIPADKVDTARAHMTAVVKGTQAEDGCLHYSYAEDVTDPGLIHVTERWTSHEALDAHRTAPHLADWREMFAELGVSERNLTLYETDEGVML
ncbi:putative quinol monooxygenase [Sphingomonas sp.]|jgi:quinol monooxygenase YgiN|uniref:putative quinol monooxygenase n=1 Tax=Sphingomonas sp. TaxID=28214 RepID=UPI002ED9D573